MSEFDRTREYLKTKLPEYLMGKGINIRTNFRCLNPNHPDLHPSMHYLQKSNTVHCFACGKSYDIFSLIGLEYNLENFKDQYSKACEMFLGTTPKFGTPKTAFNEMRPAPATFGSALFIKKSIIGSIDNENEDRSPAAGTSRPSPQDHSLSSIISPANDEENLTVPKPQGAAVFGKASRGSDFESYNTKIYQRHAGQTRTEPINYHDYLQERADHAFDKDYFKMRGISDEVVKRFRLGFDPNFSAGSETWEAVVIPYNDYSYMVRNIHSSKEDRIQKRGQSQIFNIDTLKTPGRVFVTEGEFDALSLETLGYRAVSLGGTSNVFKLINFLREHPVEGLSLCILPDNDEAGRSATITLASELEKLKIPFSMLNLCYPYKDANEALCQDRNTLAYRLDNLDKLLSQSFELPRIPTAIPKTIRDADSLLTLDITNKLHTICGSAPALRRTLSLIFDTLIKDLVYMGYQEEWHTACSLANRDFQNTPDNSPRIFFIRQGSIDALGSDLKLALEALLIKYNSRFMPIVSLSFCNPEKGRKALEILNECADELGIAVLALCPASFREYAEAAAVQNLEVTLSDSGDLCYQGWDPKLNEVSFRLSIRDF